MSQWIAFLRAINVGGHTVKMERLRRLFESLGYTRVETYIASGNVLFDAPDADAHALKDRIENALNEALGYKVSVFLRRPAELAAIAGYAAFQPGDLEGAAALNVAFLSAAPDEEAQRKLMALKTGIDDFHVHAREVYWLCRKRQSESTFSNAALERTLGQPSTLRGIKTIQKMVKKFGHLYGDSQRPALEGRN
jgi:uncharacterized protein (DUF1697 family)